MSSSLDQAIARCPVVAVVTVQDVAHAVPAAQALLAGGVCAMEITLRTPAGLPAIAAVAEAMADTDLVVGVGTVTTADDLSQALAAGAAFVVSPGASPAVLAAAAGAAVPVLPGVATVTEALVARDAGFETLKFFPAGINGGPKAVAAFADILPALRFCPTGGISVDNMLDYLRLPNVVAIGGSWLTAELAKPEPDMAAIQAAAAAARERAEAAR